MSALCFLFVGDLTPPAGGIYDVAGVFETPEEARAAWPGPSSPRVFADLNPGGWAHIVIVDGNRLSVTDVYEFCLADFYYGSWRGDGYGWRPATKEDQVNPSLLTEEQS